MSCSSRGGMGGGMCGGTYGDVLITYEDNFDIYNILCGLFQEIFFFEEYYESNRRFLKNTMNAIGDFF
jgi:hypothetical protein